MIKVPCVACHAAVDMPPVKSQIINADGISMFILLHVEEIICPNCNAPLRPIIQSVGQVRMLGVPIPQEQRKQILVVPGSAIKA
jgi:hypothetical protein